MEQVLGWIGFSLLVAAWIPQTLETIRQGYTRTNLAFIVLYVTASMLLTVYSVLVVDYVFIALNAMLTVGSGVNLFYKLFPRKVPEQ